MEEKKERGEKGDRGMILPMMLKREDEGTKVPILMILMDTLKGIWPAVLRVSHARL